MNAGTSQGSGFARGQASYLDYYRYQVKARGVRGLEDIKQQAQEKAYLFDRIVLPRLPQSHEGTIAELACGHGTFLAWLRMRRYTRLIGVDSSPEQIAMARLIIGADAFLDTVNNWLSAQPDHSVDAIVAIDLIEHISKDEFMQLLHEAIHVLRPGGVLLLRYPNGDSPLVGLNLFNDITHVWTYTTNCVRTLATMHGYASVDFVDESSDAVRDSRWIKVPLGRVIRLILSAIVRAATREKIHYWSPHIWAELRTPSVRRLK